MVHTSGNFAQLKDFRDCVGLGIFFLFDENADDINEEIPLPPENMK